MSQLQGIPGTMLDPSAMKIRWHAIDPVEMQGHIARRYRGDVSDGILVAMVGREPAGPKGELLWHLSVSHRAGVSQDGKREIFTRYPSWDEMKAAKYKLVPVDVPMILVFPKRDQKQYVNSHETCLHIWEELAQ